MLKMVKCQVTKAAKADLAETCKPSLIVRVAKAVETVHVSDGMKTAVIPSGYGRQSTFTLHTSPSSFSSMMAEHW